jgi:hypothetical protein
MYRDAVGNLQCGPIAAVLSKRLVGKSAIAWPVDTGNFAWPPCAQQSNWSQCFGCIDCVRTKPLGAPGALMHLLLPYLSYYSCANPNTFGPPGCTPHNASYNLARLAVRLLSRSTYHSSRSLPLNYAENMFGYFEYNPVVTVPMSREGIKMMIGSFGLWFGTAEGERLREWSADRGWPLAWAYNPRIASACITGPQPPPDGCIGSEDVAVNTTEDQVAVRLLDPRVLARVPEGHNCSDPDAAARFEHVWERAINQSHAPFRERRLQLGTLWKEMLLGGVVTAAYGVEPLYDGACENIDCVGVRVSDGSCVCATSSDR